MQRLTTDKGSQRGREVRSSPGVKGPGKSNPRTPAFELRIEEDRLGAPTLLALSLCALVAQTIECQPWFPPRWLTRSHLGRRGARCRRSGDGSTRRHVMDPLAVTE